eukprot:gene26838-23878_t
MVMHPCAIDARYAGCPRRGADLDDSDWGRRMACAYYNKLYKEYALVNLVDARGLLCVPFRYSEHE